METYIILLIILYKSAKNGDTVAYVVHCISYKFVL